MAYIKMDLSEYEGMKANTDLLSEALNREKDLQKQIKILSDEKIKALEAGLLEALKLIK